MEKSKSDQAQVASYVQKADKKPAELTFHQLDVDQIDENPRQPRKVFVEQDLERLASSISKEGVLQPIVVGLSSTTGRYFLVAGERRLRASKKLGLKKIPAVIKSISPLDLLRLALIENIQRADLNIIEEACAVKSLIDEHGYTQEACARLLSLKRSTVSNLLRILYLPKQVQKDLIEAKLTLGHAKALLTLEGSVRLLEARDLILKKGLNVRQAEWLCKKLKNSKSKSHHQIISPDMQHLADSLRSYLRTKIKLVGTEARGKIEVSYFSKGELERILELIGARVPNK